MIKARRTITEEASHFIRTCYSELGKTTEETEIRLRQIDQDIEALGTYTHTADELKHGAKMAWRNSNRCIGRLFWQALEVFDAREAQDEDIIASQLFNHMKYATNGGRIRPAITVFAPCGANSSIRIWNHQLVRYAGYQKEGCVVGDPASIALTQACEALGWRGEGTAFDLLPLVIQVEGRKPRWYSLPQETTLEIPLTHPENEGFEQLGLRWYAVPFVADMELEIGGIRYTAAPFNGWYMGTEIGARNLADTDRYNMLPEVARLFGLDTSTNLSLWKDRSLMELNIAVLHSFKKNGVSIVDHHTAAEQFARFEKQEQESGRNVTGRWSWLIPPMAPATTAIWHRSYDGTERSPLFRYQEPLY